MLNKTILVVDDDPMFRKVTRRQLETMGYSVIDVDSGVKIEVLIHERQPAACLIDLVMDEREGLEIISALRESFLTIKIIAVSGNADYLDFSTTLGADLALLKPIAADDLKQALSQLGI